MRISDPQAIRALAHPIRLDLLELVGRSGPVTAAQCGRALGQSQATCSFHLRQLAKYGFIEDAGPGRDRRERRWRITDLRMNLATSQNLDPTIAQQLNRVVVERETALIIDYVERAADEPADWRAASSTMSATIPMTAEQLAAVKQSWLDVLAPHIAAFEASGGELRPGQRFVRFFTAAAPLPDLNLGDDEESGSDD
ncbi:winged helix-turn-helix domain-containing protein [Streptacidiphilus cavernicola]|uniref:Winged helix-turn-helix domain-containing protein n=1 Tax=Streptacidiphilus cavernicola TaxID=3342716 RepID=A0ABV6VPN0_9ACTN